MNRFTKTLTGIVTAATLLSSCATNRSALDAINQDIENFRTGVTETTSTEVPKDSTYIILSEERNTDPSESLAPSGEALGTMGNTNVSSLAYEATANDFKDVCIRDSTKQLFPEQMLGYTVDKLTTDPKDEFNLSKSYVVSVDEVSSLGNLLTDSLESSRMIGMHLVKNSIPKTETVIQKPETEQKSSGELGSFYLLGNALVDSKSGQLVPAAGFGYTANSGFDISAYAALPTDVVQDEIETTETVRSMSPSGKYYAEQDFTVTDEAVTSYVGGANLGWKFNSVTPFVGILFANEKDVNTMTAESVSRMYSAKNDLFVGEEDVREKAPIVTETKDFTTNYVAGLRFDVSDKVGVQGNLHFNKDGNVSGGAAGLTYRLGN